MQVNSWHKLSTQRNVSYYFCPSTRLDRKKFSFVACDVDSSLKGFGFSVHLCSDPALCQYGALFCSVFCGRIYTSDSSRGSESWGLVKIGPMGVKIAQGLQEVHMD